jgi:hypothetical protein
MEVNVTLRYPTEFVNDQPKCSDNDTFVFEGPWTYKTTFEEPWSRGSSRRVSQCYVQARSSTQAGYQSRWCHEAGNIQHRIHIHGRYCLLGSSAAVNTSPAHWHSASRVIATQTRGYIEEISLLQRNCCTGQVLAFCTTIYQTHLALYHI